MVQDLPAAVGFISILMEPGLQAGNILKRGDGLIGWAEFVGPVGGGVKPGHNAHP